MTRKTKTANSFAISDGNFYIDGIEEYSIEDRKFRLMLEDAGTKSVRVQSLRTEYYQEFWNGGAYMRDSINVEMSLRAEIRNGKKHWYAFRKRGGKLYKRYVGYSDQITEKKIVEIANKMPN